jgi:O-antigen ligase
MNTLFYALFFLFSLGQLGRVTISGGQVNIYLYELILLILSVVFLFKYRLKPLFEGILKLKIIYAFNAFLILSYMVSFLNFSTSENLVAALYLGRLVLYQLFFLYVYFFLKKENKVKEYKKGFYLALVLISISSLVQYFFYPDLRNMYYLGWDPHLNRLFGVFFDTGLAAAFYGLISFYFYKRKSLFAALVFLVFLVLTFSRSAYLFYLLVISFDFMRSRNLKYLVFILLSFFLIFYFAPKEFGEGVGLTRMFSVTSRFDDYGKAFNAYSKSPVFGHGYNRIEFVKKKLNMAPANMPGIPDHSAASFSSSYLIILVSSGVIGLLLFGLSIVKFAAYKNLSVYFLFIGLMSAADNIILHPFIIFGLGSIGMVSLLYDK